jgi:hypothetical protein
MTDRHIVQVFTADESQILATLLAIPDFRLTTTDRTVITFDEVVAGAPEAIRAWFYPGNSVGQEFVYPKSRATQLAAMAKAVVPAIAVDVADAEALKAAPIVAITPEARETACRVGHPDDADRADRERRDGAEQFVCDWHDGRHGHQCTRR